MSRHEPRAIDEIAVGRTFYEQIAPDMDASHFATMWHITGLGHRLAMDLDRIARRYGLSSADLHVMGTMRVCGPATLRATDLASKLRVSNAVLSHRVAKLQQLGLLCRTRIAADRRAFALSLTPEGMVRIDAAVSDISREGHFVRGHLKLAPHEQAMVGDILARLYAEMEREFLPAARPDP